MTISFSSYFTPPTSIDEDKALSLFEKSLFCRKKSIQLQQYWLNKNALHESTNAMLTYPVTMTTLISSHVKDKDSIFTTRGEDIIL